MRLWWGTTISMEIISKWNAPLGQGPWWLSRKWHTSSTRGSSRSSYLMSTMFAHVMVSSTLQWCHNERDGVSKHLPHDCLLNRLYRRRSRKTSKLRVAGLCAGNSPVTGEFPLQWASNAENVSIWWRHHEVVHYTIRVQNIVERWSYFEENIKNIYILYDLLTLISHREMNFVLMENRGR